jgi:hypothetical protein
MAFRDHCTETFHLLNSIEMYLIWFLAQSCQFFLQPESQRYLAKQGLIVEKVGNIRKLRYIFLFNDLLVCARQKISKYVDVFFLLYIMFVVCYHHLDVVVFI